MAFGDLSDPTTTVVIVLVVIIACTIVIYAMRKHGIRSKSEGGNKKKQMDSLSKQKVVGFDMEFANPQPFRISKSVQATDASQAKDQLRILDLEREILSDALRRLYEAHAEGKISEQEREVLADRYKERMMAVKESIAKDETIIALHELESMQEDLTKLFRERFDELSSKVEELRSKINIQPVKEIKVQPIKPTRLDQPEPVDIESDEEEKQSAQTGTEEGQKNKRKRKSPSEKNPKAEADKKVEEITSKVNEILDKLGQIEIET